MAMADLEPDHFRASATNERPYVSVTGLSYATGRLRDGDHDESWMTMTPDRDDAVDVPRWTTPRLDMGPSRACRRQTRATQDVLRCETFATFDCSGQALCRFRVESGTLVTAHFPQARAAAVRTPSCRRR
jgi:hypothetical protein